jgi:hypothetical protein
MKPLLATEQVIRDGMWEGEPCCVIGGGPSFRAVNERIVLERSRTIGCNVAAKLRPDICYVVDEKCADLIETREWIHSGLRLVWDGIARHERKYLWYTLPRRHGHDWNNGNLAQGVGLGAAGVHSYNIAWLLGARPIYLLGFDCDFSASREEGAQKDEFHWHDDYPVEWRRTASSLRSFYKAFKDGVPEEVRRVTWVLEPTRLAELGYQTITKEELEQCLLHNHYTR